MRTANEVKLEIVYYENLRNKVSIKIDERIKTLNGKINRSLRIENARKLVADGQIFQDYQDKVIELNQELSRIQVMELDNLVELNDFDHE